MLFIMWFIMLNCGLLSFLMLKKVTILYHEWQRLQCSGMNNIMDNIVNGKKDHNIMNDKIAVVLITQKAYLLHYNLLCRTSTNHLEVGRNSVGVAQDKASLTIRCRPRQVLPCNTPAMHTSLPCTPLPPPPWTEWLTDTGVKTTVADGNKTVNVLKKGSSWPNCADFENSITTEFICLMRDSDCCPIMDRDYSTR